MTTPTEDDLKKALGHLAFELYHFQFYARSIQLQTEGRSPVKYPGLSQAVGYAFLMHFRALLDFFYADRGREDDLLAIDFRILPQFLFSANPRPDWLDEVKEHLNKRLAHITSPRWKERAPDMHYYHKRVPEMNDLISTFERALPPDFAHDLRAGMAHLTSRDAALWSS